jgi:UDPglucose 6-dehydrogenase
VPGESGQLGVVGLWHLGCTIAASWVHLGRRVIALDPDGSVSAGVLNGTAPVAEPSVVEILAKGMESGALRFSTDSRQLGECRVVFISHDTVVREDDSSDLGEIWASLELVARNAGPNTIVVVSSQLPVGTARELRERLQSLNESAELVYIPENLRLGEAIACYLRPGYIVIGSASKAAADAADALFKPISARRIHMDLESAEMAKHAINSYLATSISLANHWADICTAISADYGSVELALRADPRIGEGAYVSPGLGFSGGTLGRDVTVLAKIGRDRLHDGAPLFDAVLRYNAARASRLVEELVEFLDGRPSRVAVFGLTYKPGTSTLRRSRPVEIVRGLVSAGVSVTAHDPGAKGSEISEAGLDVAETAYAAAATADLALLLTGWPEYRDLDLGRLARSMRKRRILDPAGVLRPRSAELAAQGFEVGWSMAVPAEWRR